MLEVVKKHMRIFKTCNLYLSFFTLGLSTSLTGPCLLDLQHMVQTDTQHIALIYTSRSTGFLVGSIFGGVLFDIVKTKQAVLTACNFFVTSALFGIPWCRNAETLMTLMVVQGFSLGAIETGGNVVCLQLWGKDSGPFFQALHFAFGLGGLLSPLIAAPFLEYRGELSRSTDNTTHSEEIIFNFTDTISSYNNTANNIPKIIYPFSIIGVFGLLVTILLLVVSIISPKEDERSQTEKMSNSDRSFSFMFFAVIFIFLLFFVVAGTEIGFAQTLTTYAVKGRLHVTTAVGSYMTSAFWAAFTIFRLVSVFLAIKVSNLILIISDIIVIGISALILLFLMPNEWAMWLASIVFGAGIASSYACLVGWLDTQIDVTNKISSIFTVGCAAGEMIVPFIIAYFMDSIPEMFVFVTAASCVLMTILLLILYCILKTEKKSKKLKRPECYVINIGSKESECHDVIPKNSAF